ncbi:hypothetical protein FPOAC2_04680 [Fusarium poae]|uniref:hypothetical protein n=1 Tax=Fusarium poae TaxID=36050 RepID=UPI001CE7C6EC|nr:hypothetical protein FPOAC1_004590 [Fusarium poae]KAG8671343.1 hypothetical protein FPOAC1_004590 [Fusarium poae]
MAPVRELRVTKPAHRGYRSGRSGPGPASLRTKVNYFAHTNFSPTDPGRSHKDREAAFLQAEKLDSPSVMVASINEAADDWDCTGCSEKVRLLAKSFALKCHIEAGVGPTSQPSNGIDVAGIASPATEANSVELGPRSAIAKNIEDLRRQTLNKDVGNRQPFYGVHQAHFDLSRGESVTVHMRDTDKVYRKQDLQLGTIISAPFHSQKRDDTVSTQDYNTGVSAFGAVYSKYRKMIVIECWAEHVVCLPIYSYNGKGLERRRGMAAEYMDIRDTDDKRPAPGDTCDKPLLAIRDDSWAGRNTFIAGRSVVKLTERAVHLVFQKCSIEGKVEWTDFLRLYKEVATLNHTKALEVFGEPKPIESK